jgi:hypothetical protein
LQANIKITTWIPAEETTNSTTDQEEEAKEEVAEVKGVEASTRIRTNRISSSTFSHRGKTKLVTNRLLNSKETRLQLAVLLKFNSLKSMCQDWMSFLVQIGTTSLETTSLLPSNKLTAKKMLQESLECFWTRTL